MLDVSGIGGGYGGGAVLDGIDLTVARGESVALLGPNGAGKSSLMAALTATLPRRSGKLVLDGADMSAAPSHTLVAAGLALVPEGRQVFAPFTVRDNLRLGAIGLAGRSSLAERFAYVFSLFPRLLERESQRAGTLSGGEQQMVAIGRALMSHPKMLLLDEPFLGLAPLVVQEILRALAQLRQDGLTILLVEQKLDIALACTSRAYVMLKGRIVLHQPAEDLAKRPDLHDLYFALSSRQAEEGSSHHGG
jgi:branched-chain amino acid transport system ATP-binding protein